MYTKKKKKKSSTESSLGDYFRLNYNRKKQQKFKLTETVIIIYKYVRFSWLLNENNSRKVDRKKSKIFYQKPSPEFLKRDFR